MSCYIANNQLHVAFQDGTSRSWPLPAHSDKTGIRAVREEAVAFARDNGATIGQVNTLRKTLTDNQYWTSK